MLYRIMKPVTPLYINPHNGAKSSSHVITTDPSKAALQPEMESNPYAQALHDNTDTTLVKIL